MRGLLGAAFAAFAVCAGADTPANYRFQTDGHVLAVDGRDALNMGTNHYLVIRYDAPAGKSIETFKPIPSPHFWNVVKAEADGAAWKYTFELGDVLKKDEKADGKGKPDPKDPKRKPKRLHRKAGMRIPFHVCDDGSVPRRRSAKDAEQDQKRGEVHTFYFLDPGPAVWVPKK